jgi:hypothetical protein
VALGAPEVEDAAAGGCSAVLGFLIPVQPRCGFRPENKVWGVVAADVGIPHSSAENRVPPSPSLSLESSS